MHEEWEIRSLLREENLENFWKKPWETRLEWDESVWERKQRTIEREIERNEDLITRGSLNRSSVNLDKLGVKRCQAIRWGRCQENARRQMQVSRRYRGTKIPDQEQKLDQSTRCQKAIEEVGTCSIDPLGIEVLARLW